MLAAAFFCCLTAFCQEENDWDSSEASLLTNDLNVQSGRSRTGRDGSRVIRQQNREVFYDSLPLHFDEMNQYDQIAMEPFRNRYDSMSLPEKVEVYGRQFEYMHNRRPNFDPAVLNPVPPESDISDEDEGFRQAEMQEYRQPRRNSVVYDPLPLRFDDMNQYDKIAMEPFRNQYDSMSVAEKAAVYGKQFEFMRNRKPNFDPDLIAPWEVEAAASASSLTRPVDPYRQAPARISPYEAKQQLYKPATPKKRRPKPRPRPEPEPQPARPPSLLEALPGPWEREMESESEPEPELEFEEFEEEGDFDPGTPEYPRDNPRMENLRRGWNAADVMRGVRKR